MRAALTRITYPRQVEAAARAVGIRTDILDSMTPEQARALIRNAGHRHEMHRVRAVIALTAIAELDRLLKNAAPEDRTVGRALAEQGVTL